MTHKSFCFLFLLIGISAVLIAQSISNNTNIMSSAYASGDKKYKYDYNEEKKYEKGYDYKKQNSQYQQKEYDRNSYAYDDYEKSKGYGSEYKEGYNSYKDSKPTFLAKINGDNVMPEPTDSPIIGFGKFIVEEKPTTGETQLRYIISAFDVPKDEDVIAVHLHVINDEQTQTGPHIITLCGSPANEIECPEGPGVIAAGAALERDIEDDQTFITTMDQLVEELENGLGYVQIHTNEIPEGAARGDLGTKGKR